MRLACSRRSIAGLLAALALAPALTGAKAPVSFLTGAQTPAPGRPDPLTIDFQAIARDGRPVLDLRAEQLAIRIDGKARPIRSLTLVEVGAPLSDPLDPASAMPQPYGANDAAEFGRSVLIVIEDESIVAGTEVDTKEALARFIGLLGTRDRVGLMTVPHGGLRLGLTTDHGRARQTLAFFTGRGARDESDADAACRSRDTLQALRNILATTRSEDGPLTVIFVSASLIGSRGAEAPTAGLQSRRCELTPEEYRRVAIETAAAHANFFVVQPQIIGTRGSSSEPATFGGSIPRWDNNPRTGLEHLAGITGGRMMQVSGPESDTFARIVLQTSAFYVATIDPEANERNDNPHLVSVKTARRGVSIYARPDIIIPRAPAPAIAAAATPSVAADLLTRGQVYRDLSLRGVGFATRGADGIALVALLEPRDRTQPLASAAMGAYDASGRLVARWIAASDELSRRVLTARLAMPEGSYRLRVAAIDATGRAGTADYQVDAQLTPVGPLRLSALLVGLSRESGFEPRVEFATEPVAIAYFELYGRPAGDARISISLELAPTLNGPALVTVPGVISATPDSDRFVVNGAIPIGALPSGDYVVRAVVGVDGQGAARIFRVFRKQ